MRRLDIADNHTALRRTRLDHFTVADVDPCVVDLVPAVALGAGGVLPEDEITGLELVAGDRPAALDAVLGLAGGGGAQGVGAGDAGLLEAPVDEARAVKGIRAPGTPDVLAAHLGQCGLHDDGAFRVGGEVVQDDAGGGAAVGIGAQQVGK